MAPTSKRQSVYTCLKEIVAELNSTYLQHIKKSESYFSNLEVGCYYYGGANAICYFMIVIAVH